MIWGYLFAVSLNVATMALVAPSLLAQQDRWLLALKATLIVINAGCVYVNMCGLLGVRRRRHMREMPAPPFDISEVAAERRAAEMLRELLTADEWKELRSTGYLTVKSPNLPGRHYRIPAHPGVVKVYEKERIVMYLCAQPVKYLPEGDIVLMHKLHIQADEDHYLKVANRWYAARSGVFGYSSTAADRAAWRRGWDQPVAHN